MSPRKNVLLVKQALFNKDVVKLCRDRLLEWALELLYLSAVGVNSMQRISYGMRWGMQRDMYIVGIDTRPALPIPGPVDI